MKINNQLESFKNCLDFDYPASEGIEAHIKFLFECYLQLNAALEAPLERHPFHVLQQEANIKGLKACIALSLNEIAMHHNINLFEEEEVV
jgi:hypothetical protein